MGLLIDSTACIHAERNRRTAIPVLPVTLTVARVVGRIDAQLSAAGQRIPTSDLLIAATALSRGDAIVTGDARHFDRVAGLTVHRFT